MKKKPTFKKQYDSISLWVVLLASTVIIFILLLSSVIKVKNPPTIALNSTQVSQTQSTSVKSTQTTETANTQTPAVKGSGSIAANGRVVYTVDRFKKLATQPLEFTVLDENKNPLKPQDLNTVNGYKMHYIVISSNLKEFQHLYPRFVGGKWKVMANLLNAGTYYAYVDISPLKGSPVVLRTDLIVREPTAGAIAYPDLTPVVSSEIASYTLASKVNKFIAQLKLARPEILDTAQLLFTITVGNKPTTALQTYLNAPGHVTIFRQGDPASYMFLHGLASSDMKKGSVDFATTFILPGRYTAFAEFKIGSTLYTFPFTFDVETGGLAGANK